MSKIPEPRVIHEAACADPKTETEEVVRRKIQKMWSLYEDHFHCSTFTFNVSAGSAMKYAAHRRTLLDYVKDEMSRTGKVGERKYKSYYTRLRKAGAKHRRELPDAECRPWIETR